MHTNLHPIWFTISSNRFRSLEEMLDLGQASLLKLKMTSVMLKNYVGVDGELTSGSESSISVLSFSMASQTPIRALFRFLKSTRALML